MPQPPRGGPWRLAVLIFALAQHGCFWNACPAFCSALSVLRSDPEPSGFTVAATEQGIAAGRGMRRTTPPLVPDDDASTFKILQLADVHLGEDLHGNWGPSQDSNTLAAVRAVLDAEHPNLVVFSGDQITGEDVPDGEDRKRLLAQLFEPLEDRGIPWATLFGNHDGCAKPGCSSVLSRGNAMSDVSFAMEKPDSKKDADEKPGKNTAKKDSEKAIKAKEVDPRLTAKVYAAEKKLGDTLATHMDGIFRHWRKDKNIADNSTGKGSANATAKALASKKEEAREVKAKKESKEQSAKAAVSDAKEQEGTKAKDSEATEKKKGEKAVDSDKKVASVSDKSSDKSKSNNDKLTEYEKAQAKKWEEYEKKEGKKWNEYEKAEGKKWEEYKKAEGKKLTEEEKAEGKKWEEYKKAEGTKVTEEEKTAGKKGEESKKAEGKKLTEDEKEAASGVKEETKEEKEAESKASNEAEPASFKVQPFLLRRRLLLSRHSSSFTGPQPLVLRAGRNATLPSLPQQTRPAHALLGHGVDDGEGSNSNEAVQRRAEYMAYELQHSLSRTAVDGFFRSAEGGLSNYRLKLYASKADAAADKPSFLLWFVDTGGGSFPEALQPDQLAWLTKESKALEAKYGPLPGALYAHIPLPEYSHTAPADPDSPVCSGVSTDQVSPLQEGHLFPLLSQMHVGWVFSGHDHGNDWCCKIQTGTLSKPSSRGPRIQHEDIHLCYGRHSGYGGYSTPQMHFRGARVLEVNPAIARKFLLGQASWSGVKSWVRLEDGSEGKAWSEHGAVVIPTV